MNRYLKLAIYLLADIIIACACVGISYIFGSNGFSNKELNSFVLSLIVFSLVMLLMFYLFRIYNTLWRYAVAKDYVKISLSCLFASGVLLVTASSLRISLSVLTYVYVFLLASVLYCIERAIIGKILIEMHNSRVEGTLSGNIMIIGGGSAGCAIISDILRNRHLKSCKIKCVIDDNPEKQGQYISGIKIVGGNSEIIAAAEKYKIDFIIFAVPSCPSDRKSAVLNICQKTGCQIRVIPSVYQLMSTNNLDVTSLRTVEIEDLLGRDPICINLNSIMKYVKNKVVMVTGGGGSIGSELCRQIAAYKPEKLIIFDIYENNAYEIQNELLKKYPSLNLITLIGSVRDINRLECIFEEYRPHIIYHAAAHKHVPLMEDSPNESIKNNVFGTANVAKCADKYGTEKFVLISTDKAVNPTNIMGASKRICEMIVQSFNNHSKTEFVAVRFGNVLGSNGSVIPLFKKQIESGGPVTVTDPNIIRYFMTIPEAVSLVLQAGASAKGGEIFVLDMGEPVKILELAENLIRLSGYKPYTEIKIEFTGLRPGEKLFEEMLMSEEGLEETENRLIHIGKPIEMNEKELVEILNKMKEIMSDDGSDIRKLVKRLVPTYTYASK